MGPDSRETPQHGPEHGSGHGPEHGTERESEHGTEHPSALRRRAFLGACAGVGLVSATAGACDTSPSGGDRQAAAVHRPEAERERPGSPDWRIQSQGPAPTVVGYADRVSVTPGEECGLYVSTTARSFRVSAFRIGWYGGAQARLVWSSGRVPGREQKESGLVAGTRTVRTDWPRTLSFGTEGWPEGAYLLRLETEDGHQRYVPLIVRSTQGTGRTVLMHAPATWQAYNQWGGYSLYLGPDGAYDTRSLAVSFDRPYDSNGAEKFMVYERAAVVLAERLGIPLAYTTGMDVHRDPAVLHGATAVISLGHDEYWTPEQRRYVTQARDAGTNVAFLGANTCFRRVRLEDDGTRQDGTGRHGDAQRTVVCYKSSFRADPCYHTHPALVTTDFRRPPAPDPESSLTGVLYEGFPTDAPYVVHAADHWLHEGTGVRPGDGFDHLVGVEYDRVTPGAPVPEPMEITAHSPLVCNGRRSNSDSAYYTARSGAGVFATGTMRWVEALMAATPDGGRDHRMDARTRTFVTRTTENLLRAFAEGPAGLHRPAPRPNVTEVYKARA